MPFKSKAQRRWMFAAEARGEVPKGTARRWARETKKQHKKLPERVKESSMDKSAAFQAGVIAGMEKEAISLPFSAMSAVKKRGAQMGLGGLKKMTPLQSLPRTQGVGQRSAASIAGAQSAIRKPVPSTFGMG